MVRDQQLDELVDEEGDHRHGEFKLVEEGQGDEGHLKNEPFAMERSLLRLRNYSNPISILPRVKKGLLEE